MNESDDYIRGKLKGWTRPRDEAAKALAANVGINGDLHEDDHPLAFPTPAGWVLIAKSPDGADHSVVRPTYQECADFLADMSKPQPEKLSAKEAWAKFYANKKGVSHETIAPMAIDDGPADDDPGGRGPAGDRAGVSFAGEDGAGGGGPGADRLRPVEATQPDADAEDKPNRSAELKADEVAVEIEPRMALDVDAEELRSSDPSYGGTMVEKDEIARRIRQLTGDIAYAKIDRIDAIGNREKALNEEYQKLFAEGQILKSSDTERMNEIQGDLAALILRKTRTEAFAKSMTDALPGKSLDDLRSFDVAGAPWPT